MSGILAAADESRAQSTRCQKAQARLGSVGACPGNQMKRRRGLGDLLARPAAELFAHVWITFALLVPRGTTIAVSAAMALLSRWTRLFTDASILAMFCPRIPSISAAWRCSASSLGFGFSPLVTISWTAPIS